MYNGRSHNTMYNKLKVMLDLFIFRYSLLPEPEKKKKKKKS